MIYWSNFTIIYKNATREFVAYVEYNDKRVLGFKWNTKKKPKVFYTNDAFNLLTRWYIFVT